MSRKNGSLNKSEIRYNNEKIIILDHLDFTWTKSQIDKSKELWNNGTSIDIIAKLLRRHCDEVFLLMWHLLERDLIPERKGKMWGDALNG